MPLIKGVVDVDDLNSFIDIAITDDNEINPIVNVSRVQKGKGNTTNKRGSTGMDSTAWRARGGGASVMSGGTSTADGENNNDCCSVDLESVAASSRHSAHTSSRHSGSHCLSESQKQQQAKSSSSSMNENHNNHPDTMSREDENEDVVFPLRNNNNNNDNNNKPSLEDERESYVNHLEQEIAKISFELAEAQSQVDWYKMNYRHLHVEFADLQEFCQTLQDENMELRSENKQLQNGMRVKQKKRPAWFENAKLMRLGKPRPIISYGSSNNNNRTGGGGNRSTDDSDCDDWDDDTLTTNFCESSRSFLGDSASRGGRKTGRKHGTPEDKPENIVFGLENANRKGSNMLGLQ
mmetsp:Transcript_27089/g.40021  ORF Transcript_27089/g.40021 Transcript_27089/m.40021 type:complete len:350 (+) Transcript_27089:172-1221(+)